ncbi:MAG: FprA family A-type flavoprotein [Proteiniphilum sp.]|jgi:flavorubredoxin|nr:FprA family A-type flavoprotein [Proteiniphilum sp.]
MYRPVEVAADVFYVGVNDRTKSRFESLWPLPQGVSYNSYIVRDEKTALIDTVDICYSGIFMRKIRSVLGDRPLDYLVVNHMEPDHSGSVEFLISRYPGIRIVGNKRTLDMLKGYYGISGSVIEVKDLEEISLGKHTLQFHMTPMIHWPETMMTYVKETKTLFSADAFGTFGTLDGGISDTQLCPDRYWDEMTRYYSNIVGKFGSPVQTALKKLAGMKIDAICSTHGPVWTQPENIARVIALYDRMSRYDADAGLVVAYGSMYGHTEELAEIIAGEAARNGVKNIVMHNVSKSHESDILRDTFKYRGLIIGSPTYNNKLFPAVDSLLSALQNRSLKNRFFGYFGSFTWADATARQLEAFASTMEFELVSDPVIMKQAILAGAEEKALTLGRVMAQKLLSGAEAAPNNASDGK